MLWHFVAGDYILPHPMYDACYGILSFGILPHPMYDACHFVYLSDFVSYEVRCVFWFFLADDLSIPGTMHVMSPSYEVRCVLCHFHMGPMRRATRVMACLLRQLLYGHYAFTRIVPRMGARS